MRDRVRSEKESLRDKVFEGFDDSDGSAGSSDASRGFEDSSDVVITFLACSAVSPSFEWGFFCFSPGPC